MLTNFKRCVAFACKYVQNLNVVIMLSVNYFDQRARVIKSVEPIFRLFKKVE